MRENAIHGTPPFWTGELRLQNCPNGRLTQVKYRSRASVENAPADLEMAISGMIMATTRSVAALVRNRAGIRALAVAAALSPAAPLSAAGDTAALTHASAQEHWNAVVVAMAGQSGADGLPSLPDSAADAPEAALSPKALRRRNAMIIGGGALAVGA